MSKNTKHNTNPYRQRRAYKPRVQRSDNDLRPRGETAYGRYRRNIRETARLAICIEVERRKVDLDVSFMEAIRRVTTDPEWYETFLYARWNSKKIEKPSVKAVLRWMRQTGVLVKIYPDAEERSPLRFSEGV